MKRGKKDTLTGGTGDVSPQILTANIVMSAANTFTEGTVVLPQNKFRNTPTTAIVMEVLKVFFNQSEADANPAAAGSVLIGSVALSTRSLGGSLVASNPAIFAIYDKIIRGAFTAAGSYGTAYQEPFEFDLTDGNGHGYLVATDQMFLSMSSSGYTAAASCAIKILYRFKEVGLAEYVGIVQSQS